MDLMWIALLGTLLLLAFLAMAIVKLAQRR